MIINKKLIWEKIKNNKRLILELILAFFFLISLYKNFTFSNDDKDLEKIQIIRNFEEDIAKNRKLLEDLNHNVDSIHIENKYIVQRIDGTETNIRKIEKKRNESIKYIYINTPDSTVSFLSDRYNKLGIPKTRISK